jgi:HAMP domain-containing protein
MTTNSTTSSASSYASDDPIYSSFNIDNRRCSSRWKQFRQRRRKDGIWLILRQLWSIQCVIIFILLLFVICIGAIVWGVNFAFSRNAVHDVEGLARFELINRITDNVSFRMSRIPPFVQQLVLQFQWTEKLVPGDITHNVTQQLSVMVPIIFNSDLLDVQFGDAIDGSVTLFQIDDTINATLPDPYYVLVSDGNGTLVGKRVNLTTLTLGETLYSLNNYSLFDREWFVAANRDRMMRWSNIYIDETIPPFISIAFSAPYFNAFTNEYNGVISADINLRKISQILNGWNTTKHSIVMIIDSDGYLVGTSQGETYRTENNNSSSRIRATEHPSALISQTIHQITKRFGTVPMRNATFSFGSYTRKRTIVTQHIRDDFGLNWLAIANIADYDLLGFVYRANIVSGVISLSAVLATIILAIILAFVITRPIRRITKEMDKVANMDFTQDKELISHSKLYELVEMKFSMEQMKQGLRNFEKYVPASIVRSVMRTNKKVQLEVSPRELSIAFTDIKDFTTITENLDPNDLVALLKDYFTEMAEIVERNHGVIDKYVCNLYELY